MTAYNDFQSLWLTLEPRTKFPEALVAAAERRGWNNLSPEVWDDVARYLVWNWKGQVAVVRATACLAAEEQWAQLDRVHRDLDRLAARLPGDGAARVRVWQRRLTETT